MGKGVIDAGLRHDIEARSPLRWRFARIREAPMSKPVNAANGQRLGR
jgi:hypothetical protein